MLMCTLPLPIFRHFVVSNRIATCLHWYEDIPSGRVTSTYEHGGNVNTVTYHRVVGSWDVQKAFLKCYSVRPGHPDEEQLVVPAVEVSDRVMRQITASAAET